MNPGTSPDSAALRRTSWSADAERTHLVDGSERRRVAADPTVSVCTGGVAHSAWHAAWVDPDRRQSSLHCGQHLQRRQPGVEGTDETLVAGDHGGWVSGDSQDVVSGHDEVGAGEFVQHLLAQERVARPDENELRGGVGQQWRGRFSIRKQRSEPGCVVAALRCATGGQRAERFPDDKHPPRVVVQSSIQLVTHPRDLVRAATASRRLPPDLTNVPAPHERGLGREEEQRRLGRVLPPWKDEAASKSLVLRGVVDEP